MVMHKQLEVSMRHIRTRKTRVVFCIDTKSLGSSRQPSSTV
jgi:hypothetical protein